MICKPVNRLHNPEASGAFGTKSRAKAPQVCRVAIMIESSDILGVSAIAVRQGRDGPALAARQSSALRQTDEAGLIPDWQVRAWVAHGEFRQW